MMRHRHRSFQSLLAGLLGLPALLAAIGCDPTLGVPEANRPPTADARVLGKEGQNAVVDYMGVPVEITLDGTFSKDPDGSIKSYRWLSGRPKPGRAVAAAGSGATAGSAAAAGSTGAAGAATADEDGGTASNLARWVPAGAAEDWPDDVAQPKVTLPEGEYVFELWVVDNKNVVSNPSTLKVTVRTPLSPEVEACTNKVYKAQSAACKACLCQVSDACRDTLTPESVCDATCWGFLACLTTKCPDFKPGGDTGCLVNNCSSLLSGSTGATMIAPCVTPCAAQCRSM
jgi:hypothetical protein